MVSVRKLLKLLSLIIAVGLIYFMVDPAASVFVPKCPVKLMTGWDCPSCGSQRFLHALLHGRVIEAFSYNIFFIFAFPYLILLFIEWLLPDDNVTLKPFLRKYLWHRYLLLIYIIMYIAWFVLRNVIHL